MKLRGLIAIGAVALIIGLLLEAPAANLYIWLQPKDAPTPVQLFGLEGSLANGRVDGVVNNGRTVLNDVRWSLRPLPLLLGRAAFRVNTIREPVLLDGRVSVSPLGTVRLGGFRANAGLRPLLATLGYPFVPVDGQAGLDITRLVARDGRLRAAQGLVELQGVAWALGSPATPLGDYRAEVSTEEDVILAKVSSVSGPLELSGEARMKPDQTYELDLLLRPRPGAPPLVSNLMTQLGAPDPQGFYRLRREGTLARSAS